MRLLRCRLREYVSNLAAGAWLHGRQLQLLPLWEPREILHTSCLQRHTLLKVVLAQIPTQPTPRSPVAQVWTLTQTPCLGIPLLRRPELFAAHYLLAAGSSTPQRHHQAAMPQPSTATHNHLSLELQQHRRQCRLPVGCTAVATLRSNYQQARRTIMARSLGVVMLASVREEESSMRMIAVPGQKVQSIGLHHDQWCS